MYILYIYVLSYIYNIYYIIYISYLYIYLSHIYIYIILILYAFLIFPYISQHFPIEQRQKPPSKKVNWGIKLSWARGSETHVRGSARKGRGRRFEYRIRFIYIYVYFTYIRIHIHTFAQTNQTSPTILHNQSQSMSINAKSICRFHEELAFAEAPRKQNQLTNHPRKLKLCWRKQRGRPRGRQVRL